MSALPSFTAPTEAASTASPLDRANAIPNWRYALVVLGAGIGLGSGFGVLFSGTLPFFLLPITKELF